MTVLPRGQIFYDATCGLCSASYRRFGPMTERRGFSWIPLQEPRVRELLNLEGDELPPELKLFTRKGRLLGGVDAILFICKYIWWAFPLFVLSKVPGVRWLMRVVYRRVAENRHRLSGACGFDPTLPPVHPHSDPPAQRAA